MNTLSLVYVLPELDVEKWRISEVRQTLDVDNLLHLCSTFHQRIHRFQLNVQL